MKNNGDELKMDGKIHHIFIDPLHVISSTKKPSKPLATYKTKPFISGCIILTLAYNIHFVSLFMHFPAVASCFASDVVFSGSLKFSQSEMGGKKKVKLGKLFSLCSDGTTKRTSWHKKNHQLKPSFHQLLFPPITITRIVVLPWASHQLSLFLSLSICFSSYFP